MDENECHGWKAISTNVREIVRRLSSEEPNTLAEIEKQCAHEPSKEDYKEWYKVIFSCNL